MAFEANERIESMEQVCDNDYSMRKHALIEFASSDLIVDAPPIHPNCRCAVVPITDVMDYEPFNPDEPINTGDGGGLQSIGDIDFDKPNKTENTENNNINETYIKDINTIEELLEKLDLPKHTILSNIMTNKIVAKDNNINLVFDKNIEVNSIKKLLSDYKKIPSSLKELVNEISFSNQTDKTCYGSHINQNIILYKNTYTQHGGGIKTLLHEFGHAFDKFNRDGIQYSQSKEYKLIKEKEGISSDNVNTYLSKDMLFEDFAEAFSMVLNINNKDVKILLDEKYISPKEWCKKFPEKTQYIQKIIKD